MTTETIHPHAIMADFANKYDAFIKPNLMSGNLRGVAGIILDVCLRCKILEELPIIPQKGTYAKYRMALQYLSGLVVEKDVKEETLKDLVICSDRWVAEMDHALWEDPNYQSNRRVA